MNINLDMEIEYIDIKDISDQVAKQAITRLGIEAQKHAQNTINTFSDNKGYSQGVDSGAFRDGVKIESINDGFGFRMSDSISYGKYHEFGTIPHWVPFFDRSGSLTDLGEWAMRKFSPKGTFQVKGKKGGLKNPSRVSKEEVLKKMGGMIVSLDEMAPFRKALIYLKSIETRVFKEEMNNVRK